MFFQRRSRTANRDFQVDPTTAAIAAVAIGLCFPPFAVAETPFPQATPEELGLRLPNAAPVVSQDERVIVTHDGQLIVAKVHVDVGSYRVLLMPDGRLVSMPRSETTPTDRPFEPVSKKKLAKRLTEQRFPGFRSKTTRRYLYVYNSSQAFTTATGRILESMYPALLNYFDRQKIHVQDPDFPLVVVIFRTQEEFDRYRKVPPGMVAYYNSLSNYIMMFEQSQLAEVAPELAFKQAVSTIAHEGVHQILHNIGVQQRLSRWPLWLSEGLAEFFAPTELNRRVRWKGVGFVNDLRLHELSEYYKQQGGKLTGGQLLRRTVEASPLQSLEYATSWSLMHYLARYHRKELQSLLQDASQLEPLQRVAPGSLFVKHFGQDYLGTERKLIQHLQSLPYVDPVLNQTHFVVMVQGKRGRKTLVTSSPRELQGYQQQHAVKGSQFRIQAFPNRMSAKQFAETWLRAKQRPHDRR